MSLDEDVISLEVPRTPEQGRSSMRVKDALRDRDIEARGGNGSWTRGGW